MRRTLSLLIGVLLLAAPAWSQAPPSVATPEPAKRLGELIAKATGPYKQIAQGIWETTYKGKTLKTVRVRIAAADDGVFFIIPLFPRDKLSLSEPLLLRIAEFNADYDYVKLALGKTSLDVRLDAPARLLDPSAFSALEGQAALAADEAYRIITEFMPPTP